MKTEIISEKDLKTLDFSKHVLLLRLAGSGAEDALELSSEELAVLADLLKMLVPAGPGTYKLPATARHRGLELLAAWADAACLWHKNRLT